MARFRRSVLGPTLIRQPYVLLHHMPWPEIEVYVGRTLDQAEKGDIYCCMSIYHQKYISAKNAPRIETVEKLRSDILKHAEGLLGIKERFEPSSGYYPDDEEIALINALSQSSKVDEFDLPEALRKLSVSCEQILSGLSAEKMEYEETQHDPEVISLANYIAEVLTEAETKPARSNPGYKAPTIFEYHRWNLHVSPKNKDFRAFSEVVLTREISRGQMQHAFDIAKDFLLSDRRE